MNDCTFIIFGITGDLSKRKLLPGLYKLVKDKKIENFSIFGFGVEDISVDSIYDNAKDFILDIDLQVFDLLKKRTFYCKSKINGDENFSKILNQIEEAEKDLNLPGNRLVYCATPAFLFASITEILVKNKIIKKEKDETAWYRVAYEKPFGHDLKSAQEINKKILSLLDESQIYRVDHYLAKEVIENILYVRFTNWVFEALWNNKNIESVQIILSESLCLEGRGNYFDKFGMLCDVVQNHMLQLLALISMKEPKKLAAKNIRDRKAEILKDIKVVDGFFGQYDGYQDEPGVEKDSKTDTFVALKLEIENELWKGIPFYLKTGKCLDKKETRIHIQFKNVDCKLTSESCPIEGNYLTIDLYPRAGFSFELNAKKPGVKDEIVPVLMDFCYDCIFTPISPEAYENILLSIIEGDQSISVRFDEIEYSWQVIDKIRNLNFKLYDYKKDTKGPKELSNFSKKHNFVWRG